MIGSFYYYKYQINGAIIISAYQCKIDSVINNFIITNKKEIPILNITIDENALNIEKKLEEFINIIKDEYK